MAILATLRNILWSKWHPPAKPTIAFTDKTIIVTGANTGLGYEASLKYVQLDAKTVILAVRSLEKGNRAKRAIEAATGRHGVVLVWQLDMNDYASIEAFVDKVDKDLDRVDVALLNAGVLMPKFETSPMGWEQTLQVNVLSTTLLATLLLPKLKRSRSASGEPAHLTVVASTGHTRANLTPAQLADPLHSYNKPEGFTGQAQYNTSKLFIMHIVRILASQVIDPATKEPQVLINDVCPGLCRSDLARNFDGVVARWLLPVVYSLFARTTEEGARELVTATTLGKEGHGKFYGWRDRIMEEGVWIVGPKGKEVGGMVYEQVTKALDQRGSGERGDAVLPKL